MATIGQLRKRSGLLIILIGVAIALFLLTDLLSGGGGNGLFNDVDLTVGEIAGREISAKEYDDLFKRYERNYKSQQRVRSLDAKQRMEINNQAWEGMIQLETLKAEFAALGLKVSNDELWDMVQGEEPDQNVQKVFVDENGQFDRSRLIGFIQNFDQVDGSQQQSWLEFEDGLKDERERTKYFNLISKAQYVTNLEAEYDYVAKNKYASIKYVKLDPATLQDSIFTVTDEEIKAYAKKEDMTYATDQRTVQYVSFVTTPSGVDSARVKQEMAKLAEEFKSQANDIAFARLHSDAATIDETFKGRGQIDPSIEDTVFKSEVGTVIGPTYQFGKWQILKVSAMEEDSLNFYHASHILLKPEGEDTASAFAQARDILKEIKAVTDFDEMARKHGTDGTANRGGDLGWWRKGAMVPYFQKAVESTKNGGYTIAKTRHGVHIIKVTGEPTNKTYQLAIIEKGIDPSTATIDAAYDRAASFIDKVKTAQDFVNAVTEDDLNIKIGENMKPMDVSIPGLTDARQLVRWAFEQENVDAVSDILSFENEYIIAMLTEIKVEGDIDLNDESLIRDAIIKKKKIAHLEEEANNNYNADLDAFATAVNAKVESATNINFNTPLIANIGNEPHLLGGIFNAEEGAVSPVIVGDEGVYVFMVESFSEVEAPDSYKEYKKTLESSRSASAQFYVLNALKDLANVSDRRYKFY